MGFNPASPNITELDLWLRYHCGLRGAYCSQISYHRASQTLDDERGKEELQGSVCNQLDGKRCLPRRYLYLHSCLLNWIWQIIHLRGGLQNMVRNDSIWHVEWHCIVANNLVTVRADW